MGGGGRGGVKLTDDYTTYPICLPLPSALCGVHTHLINVTHQVNEQLMVLISQKMPNALIIPQYISTSNINSTMPQYNMLIPVGITVIHDLWPK